MTCLITESDRRIALGRCFNFRDVGGYETAGGRRVRWRRLFRSDGVHRLDAGDLAALDDLGVVTVLDLRTADEVRERGPFPGASVDYHHVPLLDVLPTEAELEEWATPRVMADHYLRMLDGGADSIAEVLAILSDVSAYGAVFHCAAGKDRTGVVAAVLLGLLGVPGTTIATDYALSGPAMIEMLAWIRAEYPDAGPELERRMPAMLSADPETMAMFLDGVRRRYGSFKRYAERIGVGSTIPHIRAALLE